MIEFIAASILAALTVGYWALCRFRSLPLRERASQLVTEYIEREDISLDDAQSAYGAYYIATKSWLMLLAVLMSIPLIPYIALFSKSGSEPTLPEKRKILSSCMLFHVVRNPLMSVVGLSLIFIWAIIFVALGLLTRRITSVPSFDQLFGALNWLKLEKDRHAH